MMARDWRLEKYGRCLKTHKDDTNPNWEVVRRDGQDIILSLHDGGQIIVSKGKTILESHQLNKLMSGRARGDSLFVGVNIEINMRTFKMKFLPHHESSGVAECERFAEVMRQFCTVHVLKPSTPPLADDMAETQDPSLQEKTTPPTVLQGEVTLADISQCILGQANTTLPAIYEQFKSPTSSTELDTYIRTCLTDASFPAFVVEVEKMLNNITITENEQ